MPMDLSALSITSFFESWGDQISPTSLKSFSIFDWEPTEEISANGGKAAAGEMALVVGAASLGGVMAAAAFGNLLVARESGGARMPWEQKRSNGHPSLLPSEWDATFDPATGRLKNGGLRAIGKVRMGGCHNSIRGEVWPFLLGLYDANSTSEEREVGRQRRLSEYLQLRKLAKVIARRATAEEQARASEAATGEAEKIRGAVAKKRAAMEAASSSTDLDEEGVLVESAGECADLGQSSDATVEARASKESESAAEDVQVFRSDGVLKVCEPPSLEASTESFIDLAGSGTLDSSVAVLAEAGEGSSQLRGRGEAEDEAHLVPREEDSGNDAKGEEGKEGEDAESFISAEGEEGAEDEAVKASSSGRGRAAEGDGIAVQDEWEQMERSIPAAFRKGGAGAEGDSALESFLVWRRIMRLDAVRMNTQWLPFASQTHFPEDAALDLLHEAEISSNIEHLGTAARTHAARLVCILEAYAVTDPEIGYCQGMTDLLSPFVALIEDDADAFACFARFMETARHNFRTDEVGIRKQLDMVAGILEVCDPELFRHLRALGAADCIFVYRMVIVLLRRELSFEQTTALWEVLWAEAAAAAAQDAVAAAAASVGGAVLASSGGQRDEHPYSATPARSDFFLFVVAGIVVSRRQAILQCEGLDEVLRLCNSLAGELDVWELVEKARALVALYALIENEE